MTLSPRALLSFLSADFFLLSDQLRIVRPRTGLLIGLFLRRSDGSVETVDADDDGEDEEDDDDDEIDDWLDDL